MLGYNYGRVLNIPGFRVCQVSSYVSVTQGFEYAWVWLNDALWQGSEYARVSKGAECAWISLNMPQQCFNISEYVLITVNMIKYTDVYLKKQSAGYVRLMMIIEKYRFVTDGISDSCFSCTLW